MEKEIIILAIPGIGTQKEGFSKDFEKRITKFSENTSLENNFRIIESRPFSVAKIDKNQTELFDRLNAANKLGGILSLRKMVIGTFGDGVTF